jgi:TnpA family transposase
MTLIVKQGLSAEVKSNRKGFSKKRAAYPWLPAILDEETLTELTTFESGEIDFIGQQGREKRQYFTALYLKAMSFLGHSHYHPKELPLQLRRELSERLCFDKKLSKIQIIDRAEKSRIVDSVRVFLGISVHTPDDLNTLNMWIETNIAHKESDIHMAVNAAVHNLIDNKIELPKEKNLQALVEKAINQAEQNFINRVNDHLSNDDKKRLESLTKGSVLEKFKNPVPKASPNNIAKELQRLARLRYYFPKTPLGNAPRHYIEESAKLTRRYNTSEVDQLKKSRQYVLLLCYILYRYSQLLDSTADMAIRIWENTNHRADEYANSKTKSQAEVYEEHQKILKSLVKVIKHSSSADELWVGVHHLKTPEEYDCILDDIEKVESWSSCQQSKIEDHYSSLRRFLPLWYNTIPLISTTLNNSIPIAHSYMKNHDGDTELPVNDCPYDFLDQPWKRKAIRIYSRTGEVIRVIKKPYELGLFDAAVHGLKNGSIAIPMANRYAPMLDHLLDREKFLRNYQDYIQRIGIPENPYDLYSPLLLELRDGLKDFDDQYDNLKKTFWINKDGTLGFSRISGQTIPKRLKRMKNDLGRSMPKVNIFDVLLDCNRWTGFLNVFKPTSGRQNMPDEEKLRYVLAALYAYGCNCGPSQASQALNISQNQIVYMRRRYMSTPNLMEASSILTNTYLQTPMAARLGGLDNVLMTDSMQVRTLKNSLIARQHHRYLSGKSTLLFQHVTDNFVCLFTQALLCNVSEAIHMLAGTLECRGGRELIINISDTAGKSDLVLGFSRLLNVYPYARMRSRHLKLWGVSKDDNYKNISNGFAGQIQVEYIEKGWQDIAWILASIEAGTAKPIVILNYLVSQPNHPATRGIEELGKLERSLYLLRYGTDLELRRFVIKHTSYREHWNKFTRNVQAFGDLIREKSIEDQEEVFWFLTVIQNAIILWNALSLENNIPKDQSISEEDLKRILPTMTGHINFIGQFNLDFDRTPPFELKIMN